MVLAVLELRYPDSAGLGPFPRQLLHLLQLLAELTGILDLGDNLLGNILVAIEELQELLAHPVHQVRPDFRVAQLILRLRLEHRVLQAD